MKKTRFFAALCLAAALACGMMLAACSSGPDPEEVISQDIATQFDPIQKPRPGSRGRTCPGRRIRRRPFGFRH